MKIDIFNIKEKNYYKEWHKELVGVFAHTYLGQGA
jgi:hypothetical protein